MTEKKQTTRNLVIVLLVLILGSIVLTGFNVYPQAGLCGRDHGSAGW